MYATLLALVLSAPIIPVWVRAPGDYSKSKPPRLAERTVELAPAERKTTRDLQYGRRLTYEGVPLATVIGAVAPPEDTALLHFANGMIVPVRLTELGTLDAFVATRVCVKDACSTTFEPVEKKDSYFVDRRPIRFGTNKLVVAGARGFSPFRHTDSLTGIELVRGAAYDRQFDVTDAPESAAGRAVFHARCQLCHGVRHVGASFGWDYVEPIALSEYRSKQSLAMHVRYRESDAAEKGILMPAFPEIDDATAASLWELLDAFGKKPLRPYD